MITLSTIAALVGVILGLRLTWLFLVPTVAVVLVAIAGFAIMRRSGVDWAMLAMVLAATALQVGYLCGGALRSVIAAGRTTHLRPNRQLEAFNKRAV
jgi:hypothetical protein